MSAEKKPSKRRRAVKSAPPKPTVAPEDKPLSPKERLFVAEYLVDFNGTKAAIRTGYSTKTAAQIGYENLRKPHIAKAIEVAQEERKKRLHIDADDLLLSLYDELRADLADIYDDTGNLKPIDEWPLAFRRGLVAGVEVEELFEGRGKDREHVGRVRKIKLADRHRTREMLGKHVRVQAFRDKVEHDVSDPVKELYRQLAGTGINPAEGTAPARPSPMGIRPREDDDGEGAE